VEVEVQLYFSCFYNFIARWGVSTSRPGRLTPEKETLCPLYRRLGRSQCLSGILRKISPSTGIRSTDRSYHREPLYGLSYPGPIVLNVVGGYAFTEGYGANITCGSA
jgi:hypothetical protein